MFDPSSPLVFIKCDSNFKSLRLDGFSYILIFLKIFKDPVLVKIDISEF